MEFGEKWLGKKVEFRFCGLLLHGEIIETVDDWGYTKGLVAEVFDGNKIAKICAPYQAFKILDEKEELPCIQ